MAEEGQENVVKLPEKKDTSKEVQVLDRGTFIFRALTRRIEDEADFVSFEAFNEAIDKGMPIREEALEKAEKNGWFRRLEEKYGGNISDIIEELTKQLGTKQTRLLNINQALKNENLEVSKVDKYKEEQKELAIELKELRQKFMKITSEQDDIVGITADVYADRRRRAVILSNRVFRLIDDDTVVPAWRSIDDFLDDEDTDMVADVSLRYMQYSIGLSENQSFEELYPEYQVLRELGLEE